MLQSALPVLLLVVVASLGFTGSSTQKVNLRRRCAGRLARRPR